MRHTKCKKKNAILVYWHVDILWTYQRAKIKMMILAWLCRFKVQICYRLTNYCERKPPPTRTGQLVYTRRWPNADLMLAHRLRRWSNIRSALGERRLLGDHFSLHASSGTWRKSEPQSHDHVSQVSLHARAVTLTLTARLKYFCINHGDQMDFFNLKSS